MAKTQKHVTLNKLKTYHSRRLEGDNVAQGIFLKNLFTHNTYITHVFNVASNFVSVFFAKNKPRKRKVTSTVVRPENSIEMSTSEQRPNAPVSSNSTGKGLNFYEFYSNE